MSGGQGGFSEQAQFRKRLDFRRKNHRGDVTPKAQKHDTGHIEGIARGWDISR